MAYQGSENVLCQYNSPLNVYEIEKTSLRNLHFLIFPTKKKQSFKKRP